LPEVPGASVDISLVEFVVAGIIIPRAKNPITNATTTRATVQITSTCWGVFNPSDDFALAGAFAAALTPGFDALLAGDFFAALPLLLGVLLLLGVPFA
jgi:hypothetical protein